MIRNRQTLRLKGYDYSLSGAYFITICTQDRLDLFGKIENGEMILNDAGKMIKHWLFELKNKYSNIELNEFAIMPNHIHKILFITEFETLQKHEMDSNTRQTHRSAPT